MVIKRMVVAPQRPAVGQSRSATKPPPDCRSVEQPDDGYHTQPKNLAAVARLSTPGNGWARRIGVPPRSRRRAPRFGVGEGNWVEICHESGRSIQTSAARRIRTCNQGIQGPSRFHEAWTISSSSSRPVSINPHWSRMIPTHRAEEAGRSRRGLSLGLTPLVSEPSRSPMPDRARLRIALLRNGV